MFTPLYSSVNPEPFEKYLCHQGSHYSMDIRFAKEAIMCNHQINTFRCQQRWIEYKTVKSQKNTLHVLWYTKGISQAEATLDSEKIKPVVLAVINLR